MGQDFFKYLPSELIIDILSRLTLRTTITCKCLDKSWYSLIESPGFAESYKSVSFLAVMNEDMTSSKPFKVYKVGDELNFSWNSDNLVFNFDFPFPVIIHSSANDLLLLVDPNFLPHSIFVCNPVTREYINLPTAQVPSSKLHRHLDTYGFGMSKSGEYKVVRIFYEGYNYSGLTYYSLCYSTRYCQVYTLGTGSWRRVAPPRLVYGRDAGVFANGNLHWLATDSEGTYVRISYIDLEAELFSTIYRPLELDARGYVHSDLFMTLSCLRDCLSLCDSLSEDAIVIWLMNTYGDVKSWTKQFVIAMPPRGVYEPIRVFQDGDVLLTRKDCPKILCYSNKRKTVENTGMLGNKRNGVSTAACYTPRFHPLRSCFLRENVCSF